MTSTSANIPKNKLIRQQLELINRKTLRYPLQIAEKDYFLALAIQLIHNSSLKKKLVFKGGTALHHCYIPQKRFSEDLDFTSIGLITLDEIKSVLEAEGTFRVNKVYQSDFTLKIERLQYQGLLGQPGNIKFEVDQHQNVVLPGITVPYKNVWGIQASANTMDLREICAEKIRATTQRARYRDFYDFYFLVKELKINWMKAVDLLKQKEIRTPIVAKNILNNWSIAREQKQRDLGSIYCSEEVGNEDIENLIQMIEFDDIFPSV
ncbi:MAG: nucleotidyl transferase AbiEii/AbiGii toxin family protein [Anaerolineaceae bacterium]|nr:nucleotidyl transferase AbiEii/AbiGii toxin family protein [Anaerolineaceae bacterium]